MPVVKPNWVKKTLGACLAFSFSTLLTTLSLHQSPALAHADHGTEGGIPTVSSKAKLPKGISLQVVKTNAFQFVLATDGKQQVEILGEDQRPFLRLDKDRLYADVNAVGWHRAQQPGGGPVPDRIKENPKLEPKWVLLDKQPGYGWYDPRLMNEELAHFDLQVKANSKLLKVHVERVEPEPMTGYWRPLLINEPDFTGLNAMVPGLSGNTFMLSRLGTAKGEFQVLDDQGLPFIELRKDGVWLNSMHAWANSLELFHNPGTEQAPWVKVSETGTVTYADPRLDRKPSKTSETGSWTIPVKLKESEQQNVLKGKLQWQVIVENTN